MNPHLPSLLELAVEAARHPSDFILSGFRNDALSAERKGDGSVVTHYDREAERRIRAFIAERQPENWPLLGEELGGDTDRARYRWVLDPIDGTLLAFEDVAERRALIGVIHLPAMGETYWAARGLGAWCNGAPIHAAQPRAMNDSIISVPAEHHFRLAGVAESHEKLRAQAPHLRCFADCWAHAMVARGSIDAVVEFRLSRWDIAATEVVCEEAGARVITRDAPYAPGKYDSILATPQLAADLATLLAFDT